MKYFFLKYLLWILELPYKIQKTIKRSLFVYSFNEVGSNFLFDPLTSVFPSDGKTRIGNNVFIGRNAYWGGEICAGNNIMFGPNVTLLAGNHIFAVAGKSPRFITPFPGQNSEPIIIEDEVWIGANVIILGNVTVGIGAVVGAGSVVTSNVCPFTVSVGNPSRPVRRIFDDETLLFHLMEIGYTDEFSEMVVEKRNTFLDKINIPIIDKSDSFNSFVKDKSKID